MFCCKCGKTLRPDADRCSCGQAVGDSRFEGVPYTSAQARIVPGESSYSVREPLPYTRTTYTGKDEQMQAGADADARTTYRPVYEGASVPGNIREDVRRAVGGGDETADAPADAPAPDDNPLVREMFSDGENADMDDFDLSQLRSRPIVSEGRAGISRDVSEYVEQLEAAGERGGRRARRRRVYGEDMEQADAATPVYDENGEEVYAENPEDGEPAPFSRGGLRLALKIVAGLVLVAGLAWGVKAVYDRVTDITVSSSPIAGVTASLYEEGLAMINAHADTTYTDSLISKAETDGVVGIVGILNSDAAAIKALLPEGAGADDQTFVSALSAIQTNISNAVSMDVLALSDTTMTSEEKVTRSTENWTIVRNAINKLSAAKSTAELTSIISGEVIEVSRPDATATATPVPYTTLNKGDASEEVLKLQQRLYELGFLSDGIDGKFGTKTQTAVKQFQSAAGLDVTGIADSATQMALYAEDAPRTRYAQPTSTPVSTPEPTAEPVSEPAADGGTDDATDTAQAA